MDHPNTELVRYSSSYCILDEFDENVFWPFSAFHWYKQSHLIIFKWSSIVSISTTSWSKYVHHLNSVQIFWMAVMPFLCRDPFFIKISYHRNVSLAVYLPIFYFSFCQKTNFNLYKFFKTNITTRQTNKILKLCHFLQWYHCLCFLSFSKSIYDVIVSQKSYTREWIWRYQVFWASSV